MAKEAEEVYYAYKAYKAYEKQIKGPLRGEPCIELILLNCPGFQAGVKMKCKIGALAHT